MNQLSQLFVRLEDRYKRTICRDRDVGEVVGDVHDTVLVGDDLRRVFALLKELDRQLMQGAGSGSLADNVPVQLRDSVLLSEQRVADRLLALLKKGRHVYNLQLLRFIVCMLLLRRP